MYHGREEVRRKVEGARRRRGNKKEVEEDARTDVSESEESTVEEEDDAEDHKQPSKRRETHANLCPPEMARQLTSSHFSRWERTLCVGKPHILYFLLSRVVSKVGEGGDREWTWNVSWSFLSAWARGGSGCSVEWRLKA